MGHWCWYHICPPRHVYFGKVNVLLVRSNIEVHAGPRDKGFPLPGPGAVLASNVEVEESSWSWSQVEESGAFIISLATPNHWSLFVVPLHCQGHCDIVHFQECPIEPSFKECSSHPLLKDQPWGHKDLHGKSWPHKSLGQVVASKHFFARPWHSVCHNFISFWSWPSAQLVFQEPTAQHDLKCLHTTQLPTMPLPVMHDLHTHLQQLVKGWLQQHTKKNTLLGWSKYKHSEVSETVFDLGCQWWVNDSLISRV